MNNPHIPHRNYKLGPVKQSVLSKLTSQKTNKGDVGKYGQNREKRALHSFNVLLAVIGRREREETHFRERTSEHMSALHFFGEK